MLKKVMMSPKGLKTYNRDGRFPIEKLYQAYLKLETKFGWVVEKIYKQKVIGGRLGISLPIISLRTKKRGPAIWLVAGIHGEEPAGSGAIAQKIEFLAHLAKKGIPIVLLPLCHPLGYLRDWRYPHERRSEKRGRSVGDSGHLLPDFKNPFKPRTKKPACPEAEALTSWVVRFSQRYPPRLVIDFHEDEDKSLKDPYLYFLGKLGARDSVIREVVKILLENGFQLQMGGKTENGEEIVEGVVSNVHDSSIDELLAAKKIIIEGKVKPGPSAKKVVVVETRKMGIPLKKRIKVQAAIIQSLEKFWQMV